MAKSMISARIPEELDQRLEAIAASTQRTKAFLINQAIEDLINRESWLEERIAEAVKVADETQDWISHEAMGKWISSLGTVSPLPPPEPDVFIAKKMRGA